MECEKTSTGVDELLMGRDESLLYQLVNLLYVSEKPEKPPFPFDSGLLEVI